MMQVAAEDTYKDYVICRGFDPRILKFIDYVEGNADKPGISVAKPFGNRVVGAYQVGEVHPALLPTQGNTQLNDFSRVVFTPPSPAGVNWRVGQNPGVTVGGLEGGQPGGLSDEITILYDHRNKAVNWLLVASPVICHGRFEYQLLTDWFGGLAMAYKRSMEGGELPNPYVLIRDRLGIFSFQKKGNKGHMVLECGNYYARQAPCDNPVQDSSVYPDPPPQTGAVGACCVELGVGKFGCAVTTESQCISAGGTWKGGGTSCGDYSICES